MVESWEGQRVCVTGGCGFLGRHLVRELLRRGASYVSVLDNLSMGTPDCLPSDSRLRIFAGDIRDREQVLAALPGAQVLFHLAAPTDVRTALSDPRHDIDHGILGTATLLECARALGITKVVFASSSCVYGSHLQQPVQENSGPLLPASLYGAAKLAAEGLIAAYCGTFQMQGWIFRFPNVVGPELTHGVCLDFLRRLTLDPTRLEILGDGRQRKTYMWVADCVDGILCLVTSLAEKVNVANITTRGSTTVREIAELVMKEMGLVDVAVIVGDSPQGWPGDVPTIVLDGGRAQRAGWSARYDSHESLRLTLRSLKTESVSVSD